MKKVLVFSLAYSPFVGGAEVALQEVLKRLSSKYEFQIITARMKNLPKEEVIDGVNVRRIGLGVKWLDKLLFFPLAIMYGLFYSPSLVFGLLENQAALVARIIAWAHKVPCVISLQSGSTESYLKKRMGVFYFLYNWVYAKTPRYVVISTYLKQRALSHGVPERNIEIIPNGVDTHAFSQSRAKYDTKKKLGIEGRKVIITSSRLTRKNAVEDLIEALSHVRKSIPNTTLLICGTGEDEKKLKNLSKNLGVDSSVYFLGLVSHSELPEYLCAADVFVRPSLSEGFGNSFVEALACGVPIIATPVGGIPDFLEDKTTGLFCNVRDSKDLAKKIELLLRNRELSRKISRNGQKMVRERYEWDSIAKQFDEKVFA